jgi:hypothetical protein
MLREGNPWLQHGVFTLRGPFRRINVSQEPCDEAPRDLVDPPNAPRDKSRIEMDEF